MSNQPPATHHPFRTFLAAIFGIIAFCLILASILVVWLNRTLLDTKTFVSTVSPVVTQIDVQNFIATKTSEQLLKNAPAEDLAKMLLPENQVTGKTNEQLATALKPVIQDSVHQLISSDNFATLWKTTIQNSHESVISQLSSNSGEIALDLSPTVSGLIDQLKTTKLRPIADKIVDGPPSVKLDLKGSKVDQVYHFYTLFKQLSLVLIAITFLAILLSIGISVHHVKTMRRIVFGTGILALILAAFLQAPTFLAGKFTTLDQKAELAIARVLVHNLQSATLILGVVCLVLAIGSKFHPKTK